MGPASPSTRRAPPSASRGRSSVAVCCFADITEARQRERELEERARWSEEIHLAVRDDRLVLYGQPIYAAADIGRPVRGELLLRMRDREEPDVLIEPGSFLPAAERFGLMGELDRWVLSRRCMRPSASR
jgi:predicted signal transduction protein with EAL and GGDEF domain